MASVGKDGEWFLDDDVPVINIPVGWLFLGEIQIGDAWDGVERRAPRA
jgi:hypothetical protein